MAAVDFYVIGEPGEAARMRVACRVAEKAWKQGLRVYLLTESEEASSSLDDLLWTFRQDSFVPHGRLGAAGSGACPVLIGEQDRLPEGVEVVVNLSARVPRCALECARVAELVGGDETARRLARERYRAYRESGAELRSHEV